MKLVFFLTFFYFSFIEAHHKIYSPLVEEGRQSFEWRGHFDVDDRVEVNKAHHHVLETEYSWTSFWQSELEFHISDKNDTPLDWEKTEFQNQVQIFDLQNFAGAIYFSYNFVSEGDEADEIEYKYLNRETFFSIAANLQAAIETAKIALAPSFFFCSVPSKSIKVLSIFIWSSISISFKDLAIGPFTFSIALKTLLPR